MKKSKTALILPGIFAAIIVGWNTWSKYEAGTGIFYDAAKYGFDGPVILGICAAIVVIVIGIHLSRKK